MRIVQLDLGIHHKQIVTLHLSAFGEGPVPRLHLLHPLLIGDQLYAVVARRYTTFAGPVRGKLLGLALVEGHVAVDDEIDAGLVVVQAGQLVPELKHEGRGLLDENSEDDVGHLEEGFEVENIAPAVDASLFEVPVAGNVVSQSVQKQLKNNNKSCRTGEYFWLFIIKRQLRCSYWWDFYPDLHIGMRFRNQDPRYFFLSNVPYHWRHFT